MKRCYICLETKTLDNFHKDRKRKDGLDLKCRQCCSVMNKKWYYSEEGKAHRQARKENMLIQHREYRRSKKGKIVSRNTSKRMREKYPEKQSARAKLRYAVKTGKVKKLNCRDCGSERVHGHHTDYSKPYDVIWLCDFHHKKEHATPH